ncbi:unnamed protein product [Blepharisma stoltei]|uniref:Uncharacterized protein n=1 Tax=Blepharisma stoltei TaxID=1481888 RepID=A0AAU9ITB2_9CILI|nr:unnamed protein product [Blepharisma stoltei]
MSKPIQEPKILKLKLISRGEGKGGIFAPVKPADTNTEKFKKIKELVGEKYFDENAKVDEGLKLIGEEPKSNEGEFEIVDIDMDPNEMKPEQIDILEALYKDAEGEEGELEDDFLQLANQEGEEELEEVMKEYESDSENEKEEPRGLVPKSVLDEAMEEFVQEHPTMFGETNEDKKEEDATVYTKKITYEKIKPEEDHVMQRILAELVEETAEEGEIEVPEPEYKVREDDINSVASTYTNTDNRPIIVSVRPGADKKGKKLKGKGGEEEDEKEENKKQPGHRDRGETKEEKKKRKEEIKAQKKESRERKKNIKILYKVEKSKQNELNSGTGDVASGYSIIKL